MKIMVLGAKGLPSKGGAERVVEGIVTELRNRHDITVLCNKRHVDAGAGFSGVKLVKLPTLPGKYLQPVSFMILSALYAAFARGYDIIHVHNVEACFTLPLFKFRHRVIATAHGAPYWRDKWNAFAKFCLRLTEYPFIYLTDRRTSVSLPLAEHYAERFKPAVEYIPNGVYDAMETDDVAAGRTLTTHGAPAEDYILFAAGRIDPTKGCHILLEALANVDKDIKVVVVGDINQAKGYRDRLLALADDRVTFIPFVSSKSELFGIVKRCRLFVFPSEVEAMSMMLLEAAALGTPVIFSDIPENCAVMPDDSFSFKVNDPRELGNVIGAALEDTRRTAAVARHTRQWIRSNLMWEQIALRYEAMYFELAGAEHEKSPQVSQMNPTKEVYNGGINFDKNLDCNDRFIVECVRYDKTDDKTKIMELINTHMDWPSLINKAVSHGVIPYVYIALKDIGFKQVPSTTVDNLKRLYYAGAAEGLISARNAAVVLREFDEAGIKNMMLKGAFLDHWAYDDRLYRVFRDIDLLVDKADLPVAISHLQSLGYSEIAEDSDLAKQEGRTQRHFRKAGSLEIDLHWDVMNNKWYPQATRYFQNTVWLNAEKAQFGDVMTWTMPAIDALIYQCLHASVHHPFDRLIWLIDIDRVIKSNPDIRWEQVAATIKDCHLSTHCYYALLFAKTLFFSDIPESVLEELRPSYFSARVFESAIARGNIMDIRRGGRGWALQIWLLMRDDFFDRISAFRWRAFPSIKWFKHYYSFLPRFNSVYYYPIYPLLLLLRLFRKPVY